MICGKVIDGNGRVYCSLDFIALRARISDRGDSRLVSNVVGCAQPVTLAFILTVDGIQNIKALEMMDTGSVILFCFLSL